MARVLEAAEAAFPAVTNSSTDSMLGPGYPQFCPRQATLPESPDSGLLCYSRRSPTYSLFLPSYLRRRPNRGRDSDDTSDR